MPRGQTRSPREVLGLARPGRGLGTFGGVFTPTLLTILGVIMYLREGWVIGNAGLLGGSLVILLAFGITGLSPRWRPSWGRPRSSRPWPSTG